uniref:Uncharacterized protein n=1 Tax=Rhizophagus irregularis (strain DAOM 181602 / DAOM 197198 / MUCL 43194) TaxID=747089 RepID=U9U7T5_RHIID
MLYTKIIVLHTRLILWYLSSYVGIIDIFDSVIMQIWCTQLNLEIIEYTIHSHIKNEEIRNDILKLFINKNAKYTHLYIPSYNDYHLIPGAEHCFSEIKFLKCDGRVNDNNLALLTKVCKSIKELQIYIHKSVNNYGISKLIENQVDILCH